MLRADIGGSKALEQFTHVYELSEELSAEPRAVCGELTGAVAASAG